MCRQTKRKPRGHHQMYVHSTSINTRSKTDMDDLKSSCDRICGDESSRVLKYLEENPVLLETCLDPYIRDVIIYVLLKNPETKFTRLTEILVTMVTLYLDSDELKGQMFDLEVLAKYFNSSSILSQPPSSGLDVFGREWFDESSNFKFSILQRTPEGFKFKHRMFREFFQALNAHVYDSATEYDHSVNQLVKYGSMFDRFKVNAVNKFTFGFHNPSIAQQLAKLCNQAPRDESGKTQIIKTYLKRKLAEPLDVALEVLYELNDPIMTKEASASIPTRITLEDPSLAAVQMTSSLITQSNKTHNLVIHATHLSLDDEKIGQIATCLHKVDQLVLSYCSITSKGMERLSSAIQQRDTPLQLLDLAWNKFDEIGFNSVATCLHKVDKLVLERCGITSKGMERLSSAIQQRDTPLHLLNLSWNKFDEIGFNFVATCLHKVDQLGLYNCGITSEGMERLSSAIQQRDTPMKRVELYGNDKSRESGEHIAKCLHNIEDYQHVVWFSDYQQSDGSNVVERTIKQLKQLDEYVFTNESSSSVGSGGARLEVGGCVVEIPPGALDRQVHIKLTSYYGKNEKEAESITPMLKCEPHQLKFLKPVRITLPTCYVTEDDQSVQVVIRTSMNRWDWKDFATIMYRNDLRISFDTRHFSFFDIYWPQWFRQFFSKYKSIVFRKPECFLHKTSLAVKSTLVFADNGHEATQETDIYHSTIKIGKNDDIDFELKAADDDHEPDDHYVINKVNEEIVKMKHNSIRDEFNFKIIKDMEFYPNQFSTGISCVMKHDGNELIKRWICVVVDPADIPFAPPQRHGDSPTHSESVNQSGGSSTQGRDGVFHAHRDVVNNIHHHHNPDSANFPLPSSPRTSGSSAQPEDISSLTTPKQVASTGRESSVQTKDASSTLKQVANTGSSAQPEDVSSLTTPKQVVTVDVNPDITTADVNPDVTTADVTADVITDVTTTDVISDVTTYDSTSKQSLALVERDQINAEVSRQITQTLATTKQITGQVQQRSLAQTDLARNTDLQPGTSTVSTIHSQTTINIANLVIHQPSSSRQDVSTLEALTYHSAEPLSPKRQKLEKVFQVVGQNMSRMQEDRLFYFTLELTVQEVGDIPKGTVGSRAMHGLEMWRQKNPSESAQDLVELLKANELMSIAVKCEEALQRFEDSASREDSEEGGDANDPD